MLNKFLAFYIFITSSISIFHRSTDASIIAENELELENQFDMSTIDSNINDYVETVDEESHLSLCLNSLKNWIQSSPKLTRRTNEESLFKSFLSEECSVNSIRTSQLIRKWSNDGLSFNDLKNEFTNSDVAEMDTAAILDPFSLMIPLAFSSAYYGWRTHRTLRQEKKEERQKHILHQLQVLNANGGMQRRNSLLANTQLLRMQYPVHQQPFQHPMQQHSPIEPPLIQHPPMMMHPQQWNVLRPMDHYQQFSAMYPANMLNPAHLLPQQQQLVMGGPHMMIH